MYSVYFIKKTEQHAAQSTALRERDHLSKFRSLDHVSSVIHFSAVLLFAVQPLNPERWTLNLKRLRFLFINLVESGPHGSK